MSSCGCGSAEQGSGCGTGGGCSSGGCGGQQEKSPQELRMERNLGRIRNKIVVMSGKGGVGKSTVATNLAMGLAMEGKKVGLMDVDVHGPSVPRLLNLKGSEVHLDAEILEPVVWSENLSVMSIGFLLPSDTQPVIWRGPVKIGFIQQMLSEVSWGDLDYLIVDCPPGTGDEPLSVFQMMGPDAQAVIVTTPQGVAIDDVRRSITFVGDVGNSVLGVVENMSGVVCSQCGNVENIFGKGGGEALARELGVRFLGAIPMDPEIVRAGDEGYAFLRVQKESPTAAAYYTIMKPLLMMDAAPRSPKTEAPVTPHKAAAPEFSGVVKVAVPLANGVLTNHFGHCEKLAIVGADFDNKKVVGVGEVTPPPHEPGVMPKFVADQGCKLVIAGGMGVKAQELFVENGVTVITGAPVGPAEAIVQAYMDGELTVGANACDH